MDYVEYSCAQLLGTRFGSWALLSKLLAEIVQNLSSITLLFELKITSETKTNLTFSLFISCLSSSLSFRALASLCRSVGSFRNLLSLDFPGASPVSPPDTDLATRVLALSDTEIPSLSGREDDGTISNGVDGPLMVGGFFRRSNWILPLPAACGVCCDEDESSTATFPREVVVGPGEAGDSGLGLGCPLDCLLPPEGLRLGDLMPCGGPESVCLGASGASGVGAGVSVPALTGDLGVLGEERVRAGVVATRGLARFGMTANRFLLWRPAEGVLLEASPFGSFPSLYQRQKGQRQCRQSANTWATLNHSQRMVVGAKPSLNLVWLICIYSLKPMAAKLCKCFLWARMYNTFTFKLTLQVVCAVCL